MTKSCVVILSLGLVLGAGFGTAQTTQKRSDQTGQLQVTPEFSAAENVVEELTGTAATDPESQDKLLKARAVFQAALDQYPNSTLALNFLARTYSLGGQDMALGIAAFEKSLAIDRNQPDAIVRLVALYLKAGQRPKAEELRSRLVNRTANPELAAKVDRQFSLWDGAEGQRLIREGHPEQGLALIDKAIENSTDPTVQQDLREMRKGASRDWEATLYNSALEKAKAGDYRGAMSILDKLLPMARDPEVVERAKRLRDKLVPVVRQNTSS